MAPMGLVVFPLFLVLLIQPVAGHDPQIKGITATGLGSIVDAIDTTKDTHSPDDIKNIGGEIQTALESGGRNDKAFNDIKNIGGEIQTALESGGRNDKAFNDIKNIGGEIQTTLESGGRNDNAFNDMKNIGGEIQIALESGGQNDKAFDVVVSTEKEVLHSELHEAFLMKPEAVKNIASSPEIKSWLVEVFRVYRNIAGDAAVNTKGVASTIADLDVDAIKKMCGHVKEALGSGSLKANAFDVALTPEDEQKAMEFSAFLPVMSMVNAGIIKPEVLKKLASSPEIKSWFAKFDQEYKSFAGGAASVHPNINVTKMVEEEIKEVFQIGDMSDQDFDLDISPIGEEEFIENGFLRPLMLMADARLMEENV